MGPDERVIREPYTTWVDAANSGDLVRLLALMANDVVFLNPGRAPARDVNTLSSMSHRVVGA
jgi:ketosteroid isomerase-like protein